ncbi:MAG: GntR family transcriptional regulator, partial [Bacteroidota bacterium]
MKFNDQQAIYLQIADYICEQILLEKWSVEERIPSVRDLAAMMEVNPNTVVRSYDFLQQRDIIY